MHFRLASLIVGMAILSTSSTLAGRQSPSVRTQLSAIYTQIGKAMKQKNVPAILKHIAPDYRQRGLDGRVSGRAETEADHKETFAAARAIDLSVAILGLEVKGATATARVRWRVEMVTAPKVDPAGKTHRVIAAVPLRHTWVRTAAGWKLRRGEELSGGTLTIDGKPQKIDRR